MTTAVISSSPLEHFFAFFGPPPPPPPPPPSGLDALFGLFQQPASPPIIKRARPFLVAFIFVAFAAYCWEQYLRWRTRCQLQREGVPASVRAALGDVNKEEYARAQAYSSTKNSFGFFTDALSMVRTLIDLQLAPLLWNRFTSQAVLALGLSLEHELARMVCLTLVTTPLELLLSMPLSYYRTFVIEERYGFNNHTRRSWLSDTLKALAVEQVMGLLMMVTLLLVPEPNQTEPNQPNQTKANQIKPRPQVPLVLVLRNLGELAWLYAWAFITLFVLVFNMLCASTCRLHLSPPTASICLHLPPPASTARRGALAG